MGNEWVLPLCLVFGKVFGRLNCEVSHASKARVLTFGQEQVRQFLFQAAQLLICYCVKRCGGLWCRPCNQVSQSDVKNVVVVSWAVREARRRRKPISVGTQSLVRVWCRWRQADAQRVRAKSSHCIRTHRYGCLGDGRFVKPGGHMRVSFIARRIEGQRPRPMCSVPLCVKKTIEECAVQRRFGQPSKARARFCCRQG